MSIECLVLLCSIIVLVSVLVKVKRKNIGRLFAAKQQKSS